MEQLRRARLVGYSTVVFAVIFRLLTAGIPAFPTAALMQPKTQQFLIPKETGRNVRSLVSEPPTLAAEPVIVEIPLETVPRFSEADLGSISIMDLCHAKPNLAELMAKPLTLNLTGIAPTVLILHTHTTESYRKAADYAETAPYRTLEEQYNLLAIGDRVTALLEAKGIPVLHDREIHDYPDYNSSYAHARKAIRSHLADFPSIQLILDIHRDAMEDKRGRQLAFTVDADGQSCAQIMLVMGTGNAGASNEFWKENLSLGLKLTALLERFTPGITRPISLRSQRFNQDLKENTLLVEIGAAGNTLDQALLAADKLAEAIAALKSGSQ